MAYPTSLVVFTTKRNNIDIYDAAHMNAVQTEIVAIETKLGISGGNDPVAVVNHLRYIPSGLFAVPMNSSGDVLLTAVTANILVNSQKPKRAMYVPASAMFPSTTAGCATLVQVESSTNKVNVKVLDFDGAGTSKEFAEFGIQAPTYWDAGPVKVQFVWLPSAGSGTVNWEIQAGSFSDGDVIDTAYGPVMEVTDTVLSTGQVHISPATGGLTIGGSPVAGDWLQFRVARDPANDTDTSDARLLGIRIEFGVKQYTDA